MVNFYLHRSWVLVHIGGVVSSMCLQLVPAVSYGVLSRDAIYLVANVHTRIYRIGMAAIYLFVSQVCPILVFGGLSSTIK